MTGDLIAAGLVLIGMVAGLAALATTRPRRSELDEPLPPSVLRRLTDDRHDP